MRIRAVLSLVLLLVLSTAASVLVLRQVLLTRIDGEVDEALLAHVESIDELAAERPGRGLEGTFDLYLEREPTAADEALVAFIEGEPYAVSDGAPPALAQALAPLARDAVRSGGELETPLGDARFAAVPTTGQDQDGVLAAAALIEDERNEVESAVWLAAGVGAVVILLSALFMWIAAGRTLQPLRSMARTTRIITETDISGRVDVSGTDELAELGRTFNRMLDRLELAFADQKGFLADVGHELRTPITVIGGYLETLGDDPAERREAMAVIRDELERMSRLVDDLLLLARSDRPGFLRPERLDLDLMTNELFAKARLLGSRRWELDEVGLGLVVADPHRITSAVMNLAQNAVRHTRSDQLIAMGSAIEGTEARIWVRDEGVGIPSDRQARIFERGEQGADDGPGAGLGLAIVRAVAEAHGGRVELDSEPGAGARFTIILPALESPLPEEQRWPGS